MGAGTEDRGTYNRMTRTLPKQPSRCTGVMTFYEQPNFQLFMKEVKKVIRTCVQEGRENELLDDNQSLVSAWKEMMQQPVSMNLEKGRKIEILPQYDWERTSGPPFWRTTRITFNVKRKKVPAPPIPQYQVPDVKQDKPKPPVPRPIDPCSRSTTDCKPAPPLPTGYEEWFYCTEAGIKSITAKWGEKPPPQADATSGFYPTWLAASLACQKDIIDQPPPKKPPEKKPPEKKPPEKKPPEKAPPKGKDQRSNGPGSSSDAKTLSQLNSLVPLFLLFASVVFLGEEDFLIESMFEVFDLRNELQALYPGEEFLFELNKNRLSNKLAVNVIRNGVAQDLQIFIDNLYQSGTVGERDYDRLKDLANTVEVKMQQLDGARSLGFARKQGTWVRGFFIEDTYIEKNLQYQGYVGLPDYFQGYDAYKQGARFSVSRAGGKYVTTFYDPDLISIKSYEPKGGLRNIDRNYLGDRMDEWLTKMNPTVFEKKNIKIVLSTGPNKPVLAAKKEVHLILLGDGDVSQFRQKIKDIAQLATEKRFTIKIIQYVKSTGTFKTLL